ncbi:MAG: SPOR domain-containing protein [Pseudomonadota bacterium]
MLSSMGYTKYGIVFLISAWMFFLGVLVGRGTAPVSFDTKAFQEQLKTMAKEYTDGKPEAVKPDLVFYEVLKKPSRSEGQGSQSPDEILPRDDANTTQAKMAPVVEPSEALKKQPPPELKQPEPEEPQAGRYTIQVASFKDLEDAVKVIQNLETKGYPAYKTLGTVGDEIWFRVRTGSFATMDEAQGVKRKLETQGIKALIIQKD